MLKIQIYFKLNTKINQFLNFRSFCHFNSEHASSLLNHNIDLISIFHA